MGEIKRSRGEEDRREDGSEGELKRSQMTVGKSDGRGGKEDGDGTGSRFCGVSSSLDPSQSH